MRKPSQSTQHFQAVAERQTPIETQMLGVVRTTYAVTAAGGKIAPSESRRVRRAQAAIARRGMTDRDFILSRGGYC